MIRILLAEDDPALRAVIAKVLRKAGYDVTETPDGHSLLRDLANCYPLGSHPPPELVLSDVRMPGPDGLRIMQQAQNWGQPVRFILMTAYASADFEATASEYGAAAVLEKPFALNKLLRTVQSALHTPTNPVTTEDPMRLLC